MTPRPYFGGPCVHTVRVALRWVEPTVWRTLTVPAETKLPRLNRMLEAVMGWEGYHFHVFEIGDLRFGSPDEDDSQRIDERKITVDQVLPRVGSTLCWAYDFGDSWQHDVTVEAIDEPASDIHYPICTDGAQACPPEDCGGVTGYYELRMVLANPDHLEYEHLSGWAPDGFDPEAFDQIAVNRRLRRVR